VDNPECDRWREVFLFGTTDLLIRAMGDGTLSITAGKNQLPFQEFVSFGRELKRRILTFDHPLVASAFKAQRLRVTPLSTPSGQQRVVSSTEQQAEVVTQEEAEGEDLPLMEEAVLEEGTGGKHRNVTIDSEQFELRPFTLTLLRDRIRFYLFFFFSTEMTTCVRYPIKLEFDESDVDDEEDDASEPIPQGVVSQGGEEGDGG
ncbi:unnamed protein product, partial [Cyprideis torosa]